MRLTLIALLLLAATARAADKVWGVIGNIDANTDSANTIVWRPAAASGWIDPNYAQSVLLMYMDPTSTNAAGKVEDHSTDGGNHGSFVNMSVAGNWQVRGRNTYSAQDNHAYDFNGTDERLEIADDTALSFGDGSTDVAFTIAAWGYMHNPTGFVFAAKETSSAINSAEWIFSTRLAAAGAAAGSLTLNLRDNNSTVYISRYSTATINADARAWHHYAAVYTGGKTTGDITLYRDGQVLASTALTGGSYGGMENLAVAVDIGCLQRTYFANGLIDDVRIYKGVALTATQISNIWWNTGGSAGQTNTVEVWQ